MSLPTETKVKSGTSQDKSGTSVNLSNSGLRQIPARLKPAVRARLDEAGFHEKAPPTPPKCHVAHASSG